MTEKQPKAKSGLRRFAGDMVYSLAGLMILNMTLSFGVYPFLRSRMGAEGSRKNVVLYSNHGSDGIGSWFWNQLWPA